MLDRSLADERGWQEEILLQVHLLAHELVERLKLHIDPSASAPELPVGLDQLDKPVELLLMLGRALVPLAHPEAPVHDFDHVPGHLDVLALSAEVQFQEGVDVEHLLEEANLNTLVLVRKDQCFLGIFSQQEAYNSKSKEEFLATS